MNSTFSNLLYWLVSNMVETVLVLNVFFRLISGNKASGVCFKTAIGVCQWSHTGYFSIGSGGGLAPCGDRSWSGTVLTYACNDISPLVLVGGWSRQVTCHGLGQCWSISVMRCQCWSEWWLGAVRHHAMAWANVDRSLTIWHHCNISSGSIHVFI